VLKTLCTRLAQRSKKASYRAVALARCIPALDRLKLEGDEQIGVNLVKRALQEPLRQIAQNAGEEGAIVFRKVTDSKDPHFGFNALTGEFGDLVKAGVLNPTKVVRTALTNAGSIASLMLTTEALVADLPEEDNRARAPGGQRSTH
jgi:chaperonin GroEL